MANQNLISRYPWVEEPKYNLIFTASNNGAGLRRDQGREHDEGLGRLRLQTQRPQERFPRGTGRAKGPRLLRSRVCAEQVVEDARGQEVISLCTFSSQTTMCLLTYVSCIFRTELWKLGVNPHLLVMSTIGYLNEAYKDHDDLKELHAGTDIFM